LIAERGGWDFEETKFLKKIIKKGDTVIDVGANIGYYTLLFSKLVGKEGKIYAYEPLPENFKLLKKNIFINKYKNIVLINRALSNKEKNAKLYIDQDDLGACSLHTEGVVGGVKEKMLNI
jgi:FkbM family methyltransferase